MQIENTNTFMVSGGCSDKNAEKPPEAEKRGAKRPLPSIKPSGAAVRRFMKDFASAVREGRRKLLLTAAGLAITAVGAAALGTYCTVGVNYYCGGTLLCTVAATDDAAAIIGLAAQRADELGVPEQEIQTSAKLALKSSLVGGEDAINAILAASPYLCRAYIVSADGKDLFTVESKNAVSVALDEYVKKYSLNSSASLSGDVEIREQIVSRNDLTPTDTITSVLEESGVLTVMNTVDLTEQYTIAHETEEIADDTLFEGETVVETEGSDGTEVLVNEQIYSNGELLSSAIISSETKLEPVTEVLRVGTKPRNALEEGLSYPLSGRLSSGFGERWGRQHRGVDLAVGMGTPVAAAASGTVICAEYKESYGNIVQVDHGYGIVTTYAHLDSIAVAVGQKVERGEVLAYSGNTGNSTGPHLHFEVILNGEYLNPLDYLL